MVVDPEENEREMGIRSGIVLYHSPDKRELAYRPKPLLKHVKTTYSAFGHTVRGMKVQMYDFYKHGILSDYDGLLGLDFFKNTKFCIDMNNQTIEVFR